MTSTTEHIDEKKNEEEKKDGEETAKSVKSEP